MLADALILSSTLPRHLVHLTTTLSMLKASVTEQMNIILQEEDFLRASDSWDTVSADLPSASFRSGSNGQDTHAPSSMTDIDVEEPSPHAIEKDLAIVALNGVEYRCSRSRRLDQSAKLAELVQHVDGKHSCIHLPLSSADVSLLTEALNADRLSNVHWIGYPLQDLIRIVELFTFYEFRHWNPFTIETAILDYLTKAAQDETSPYNLRMVSSLRSLAQSFGMSNLQEFINLHGYTRDDYGDIERPRKWQKVSTNHAVASVPTTSRATG